MPPALALTCVVPLPTAVTSPVPLTVATAELVEFHAMLAPAMVAMAASRATAENCTVRVSVWNDGAIAGAVIATEATAGGAVPPPSPPPQAARLRRATSTRHKPAVGTEMRMQSS